jgi:YtkA-like
VHLRMAPEALTRCLRAGLLASCCLATTCGSRAADITVAWTIDPMPPAAAETTIVRFTLADSHGTRVGGAKLRLDAHMTHPGMAPVTSDVIEISGGTYQARVHLSMAGDWVFVVSGELPDGHRITKEIQVPAVRPAPAR